MPLLSLFFFFRRSQLAPPAAPAAPKMPKPSKNAKPLGGAGGGDGMSKGLLGDICKGSKLKKTTTVDKSAPGGVSNIDLLFFTPQVDL